MGEATFRRARTRGFEAISRDALQDNRLSLKARGLYGLMMSLPDDWEYTIAGLAKKAGCGKDQIRSGLGELLKVGYLVKEQTHGSNGKFSKNLYFLLDTKPPLSGNPTTGNPSTVFPLTENPTENNKDKKKTEIKPPISPEGQARFQAFWDAYPRKVNKKKAAMDWDKLERAGMSEDLFDRIMRSLEEHKRSRQWTKDEGQYIPHASTFLHQKRWEDELPGQKTAGTRVVEEEGVRTV